MYFTALCELNCTICTSLDNIVLWHSLRLNAEVDTALQQVFDNFTNKSGQTYEELMNHGRKKHVYKQHIFKGKINFLF